MSDNTCVHKNLTIKRLLARLRRKNTTIAQLESELALTSSIMRLLVAVTAAVSAALALTVIGVMVL